MANNKSGQTAFGAAAVRLVEQYQPKETRLFTDPVIKDLITLPIRLMLELKIMRDWLIIMSDSKTKGIYGSQICRTKYIDDLLQLAIGKGVTQIVILGAGLDTRPYRIPSRDKIRFFEVDMPSVQDYKKKKIGKYLGSLPANVVYIPIDFNSQTLDEAVAGKGLDLSKPIFFIWEGVTQYITEDAVRNTLRFISKSSPGSSVVFTYVLKSVIDRTSNIEGADDLIQYFAERDIVWHFGLDPLDIADYLKQFNLELIEDIGASYCQEKYLQPLGRNIDVSEIERIVYTTINLITKTYYLNASWVVGFCFTIRQALSRTETLSPSDRHYFSKR